MKNVQIFADEGCDPEAFLVDAKGRGVPAHEVGLPYKGMPRAFARGAALRDGYAVEFNPRFAYCRTELIRNFWQTVWDVNVAYKIHNKGLRLITKSAIPVDLSTVRDWPNDVGDFGCDGSWNAYTQKFGGPKINGFTHPLRYSGGHIHVSAAKPHAKKVAWASKMENVFRFIRMCDRWPGLISVYLTGSEWSGMRRRYYGKAGEFRVQEHANTANALEYRTLGSEIFSHYALLSLELGLVRRLYENFDEFSQSYDTKHENQVKNAINGGESDDDLLDLIPPMPGWYDHKLLRKAKTFFQARMHNDLIGAFGTAKDALWQTGSKGKGWGEWCRAHGYIPRRDDLRHNDLED